MPANASVRTGAASTVLLGTSVLAVLGAVVILLVPVPAVWRMAWAYGLLFGLLGLLQVLSIVAVLIRGTRHRVVLAGGLALAVIVLWALRSVLPAPNPWVPSASVIGFLDLVCVGLEAVALVGFGALLVPSRPRSQVLRALLVLPVVPLAVVVVVGTGAGVAGTTDSEASSARTVEYCRPDGVPLSMDLYPPASSSGPSPVVLYLHGGGMIYGDRTPTGFGARMSGHVGALFPALRRE